MKTRLILILMISQLVVSTLCSAEEIDLPGLSGHYIAGPRPGTEQLVTIDLTQYASISSLRFEVAGVWHSGSITQDGVVLPVDGCVALWIRNLDLNYPMAWSCTVDGAFLLELDTFWITFQHTVTDWSFLLEGSYEVVLAISASSTYPEDWPSADIESVTLIVDGVVPNEQSTWGTLKALYR
jgi:hypothetical protein